MNLINTLNQLSFKQLFAITFLIALFFSVPIVVWTALQQTRTEGSAYFMKPEPISPEQIYGAPSVGNPQITLVWPFVGKVNDVVLIHGLNFGQNPQNKQLFIGNLRVEESFVKSWQPELIEFLIPPNSSFGPVSLTIEAKNSTWPFPFTVYGQQTLLQVTENNGIVWTKNNSQPVKMTLYLANSQTVVADNPGSGISYPSDQKIVSVSVSDTANNPLPFFVEPAEFDF